MRVAGIAFDRRVEQRAASGKRRIERDLHDGTQQRLVSLAIRLGMARATPAADAAQANLVIAEVGTGGQVELANFAGSTDVVVDVVGWFS